jgi:hypothetical protein
MSFPAELIESGISIANSLTKGVQGSIILEQLTGMGPSGDATYGTAIPLSAVVDYTNKVSIRGGQILTISATVTILETVPANGAITDPPRVEPIDPRDRITLPDGTSGQIISTPGAVNNPNTGTGFIQNIEIGNRS